MDVYTLLYLKWITSEDRECCCMSCGGLDGRSVWGRRDTHICMAGSLHCLLEAITISFVNWLYFNTK